MFLLTSSTQPWIRSMLSRISSTYHEHYYCYYYHHYSLLFIIFQCCPDILNLPWALFLYCFYYYSLLLLSSSFTIIYHFSMLSRSSSTCHDDIEQYFLNQGQHYSSFSSAWIYNVRHFYPSTPSNQLSQHKKFIFCFSLLLLSIIWPIPMYHLSGRVWKRQWMNSLWSRSVEVRDNLCVEQLVMLFEMCAWVAPSRIWLKQHNNDVILSFCANFLLWKMTKTKEGILCFCPLKFSSPLL